MPETKPGRTAWGELNYLDRVREADFVEEELGSYLIDIADKLSRDKFPVSRARLFFVFRRSLKLNADTLIARVEEQTRVHGVVNYSKTESDQPGKSFSQEDVLPLAAICWTTKRGHEKEERINVSLHQIVQSTQDSLGPDNFLRDSIHEPSANGDKEPRIKLGSSKKRSESTRRDEHQRPTGEILFDEKVRIGESYGVLELGELAKTLPPLPDGLSSRYVNLGLARIVIDIYQRLTGEQLRELDEIPLYFFKETLISLSEYMKQCGIENLDEFRKRPITTIEQIKKAIYGEATRTASTAAVFPSR